MEKNILLTGCIVLCVWGLQACDITISNDDSSTTPANENTVATFDCNKQSKMKFREENSNITLDGQCESVQIVGKNNTFIIANTQSLQVSGTKNTVYVKQAKTVQLAGTGNKLHTDHTNSMAVAGMRNSVKANTVNKIQVAGMLSKIDINTLGSINLAGLGLRAEYQQSVDSTQPIQFHNSGVFNKAEQIIQ